MLAPFGFTVPFRVAEEAVTELADPVVTVGISQLGYRLFRYSEWDGESEWSKHDILFSVWNDNELRVEHNEHERRIGEQLCVSNWTCKWAYLQYRLSLSTGCDQ